MVKLTKNHSKGNTFDGLLFFFFFLMEVDSLCCNFRAEKFRELEGQP